jgi:phospholipid/cholesterol/gamma-HCH transport system substrate-binding protein
MITKSQKARLGIFVAVAAVLTGAMFVSVLGTRLTQKKDTYYARFTEAVSGLDVGAQVKYQGVKVGSVDAIEIDRKNIKEVIVTLSLKRGTPVKADTKVTLAVMGITGLKSIELTGGSNKSAFLEAGSLIKTEESLISRLSGRADIIAEKIELITNRIVDLTGDEQRTHFKNIIENADRITGETATLLENSRPDLEETLTNLRAMSEDGKRISADLAEASAGISLTIEEVRSLVAGLDEQVSAVIQRQDENLDALLVNGNRAVGSMADILDNPDTRKLPNRALLLMVGLQELVAQTKGDLSTITHRLDNAALSLNDRITDPRIDLMLDSAAIVAKDTEGLVQGLDLTVRQSREDIFKTLSNLKDVVRNLNDFTQMLLENPSVLLRGSQLKEREQ